MEKMNFNELYDFYYNELFNDIMNYWMKRSIDKDKGGFFTCFSNDGNTLFFKHKFTWSQGRFIWMLSRLYNDFKGKRPEQEIQDYYNAAKKGAYFLINNCLLDDNTCAFILNEDGEPILLNSDGTPRKAKNNETYATSIYADFFVLYGISEFARISKDKICYDFCKNLYKSIDNRIKSNTYKTEPYPVPKGYKTHGIPMISLETYQEFAKTASVFNDISLEKELKTQSKECIDEILNNLCTNDNVIIEFIGTDNKIKDNILGTHIKPGHAIEDMWFMMHFAKENNRDDIFDKAVSILVKNIEIGWDKKFGGIPQFLHMTGEKPKGNIPDDLKDEEMIKKLQNNWDNKLWWVHSESLYTCLLAYTKKQDEKIMDYYWQCHEYTFNNFPNPDKNIGEWIQILDRQGKPVEKVVALPVKDPFHITRNYLLILNLLNTIK